MINPEDAWHRTSENPSENEARPDAVTWDLLKAHADELREQGHTLQSEGIEYLVTNGARPRCGVLAGEEEKGLQFWWYYCDPTDSVRDEVLNVVPPGFEKSLSGALREESNKTGIIVHATFSEAVRDFGLAWDRWKTTDASE